MVLGPEKLVLIFSTFALFDVGLSLECSHTTDTREWSLSVVCWDKTVKSFDVCKWYVTYNKKQARVVSPEASPSPDKFFNCSGKWSLPLSAGEYIYRILLAKDSNPIAFNLTIGDPGEVTVNDCKHEVSEGDNVTCTCSTQREGSPPPVISWAGETTSPTLRLDDIRVDHKKTYTCEMIWGNQTKTVSYNLLVRAVRDQVEISGVSRWEIVGVRAPNLRDGRVQCPRHRRV